MVPDVLLYKLIFYVKLNPQRPQGSYYGQKNFKINILRNILDVLDFPNKKKGSVSWRFWVEKMHTGSPWGSLMLLGQCYWDELMLLKCKLMQLKCQVNPNTNKNGFLHRTKCLKGVLKILILNFNYLEFYIYVCGFLKSILWLYKQYIKWRMIDFWKIIFLLLIKCRGVIILYIIDYFINYL